MRLDESQRRELYLFLVLHGKTSMRTTVERLLAGATVTDVGREASALGSDARVVENLVAGRLVHHARTWRRRTERVARLVVEEGATLSFAIRNNAAMVLEQVALLGGHERPAPGRRRDAELAALL